MKIYNLPKNYFYTDACSPEKYAHLKNCTKFFITGDKNSLVELRTIINSDHHIYLRDHIFKGDCFVPAAMIMEIFVEASAWFSEFYLGQADENKKIWSLNDFSIERDIAVRPGNSLEFFIQLIKVERYDSTVNMKIDIVSKRINASGKSVGTRINATTIVVLSERQPVTTHLNIPEYQLTYHEFLPKEYYTCCFPSPGPMFQSQTGRLALDYSKNILLGEYNCEEREKNFIKGQVSSFLISPLGYDSCIQYNVFLARIKSIIGRLPVGGKRINIYSKHPETGNVRVLVKCLQLNDDIMVSNYWSFKDDWTLITSAREFIVRNSLFYQYENKSEFEWIMEGNRVQEFIW